MSSGVEIGGMGGIPASGGREEAIDLGFGAADELGDGAD
jgi:hypothetical protein